MKSLLIASFLSMALALPLSSQADDFSRVIESRPAGKEGTWKVGGREFTVTQRTEFDGDEAALMVGACVQVEYNGNTTKEVEAKKMSQCE